MKHSFASEVQSEPQPLSIDPDFLAVLLWDHFGGKRPRVVADIVRGIPVADANEIAMYRECARSIIASLENERDA